MIMALDLSSKSSGYAIGNDTSIIDYGCITSNSNNLIERIIKMRDVIIEKVKQNKISIIVLEEVRTDYKNAKTYKALTWLQGSIVIALYELNQDIELIYLQPSQWRSAIGIQTGRGIKRAELKQADIDYVNDKYKINTKSDDIADAICIHDAYYIKENSFLK